MEYLTAYLIAYAAALAVFLALDIVWLKTVMKPVFERRVPDLLRDRPRLGIALGFYFVYVLGLIYFAAAPGILLEDAAELGIPGWIIPFGNGAFLGLLAYGTYEATNMATLRGWTAGMMALDIAWGTLLSALAAVAGFFAGNAYLA